MCWGSILMPAGLILLLLPLCPESGPTATGMQRKPPFLERLRRLEEQFRRFREATLTHLQRITANYNVSYNVDTRFQNLTDGHRAIASTLREAQAAAQADRKHLETWKRKVEKRTKVVRLKLSALEASLEERGRQGERQEKEREEQRTALSNLTGTLVRDIGALWADGNEIKRELREFQAGMQGQEARLGALEEQMRRGEPGGILSQAPLPATEVGDQASPEKQAGPQDGHQEKHPPRPTKGQMAPRNRKRPRPGRRQPGSLADAKDILQDSRSPKAEKELERATDGPRLAGVAEKNDSRLRERQLPPHPQKPGSMCNVGPVLVFPNSSPENAVSFGPGFPAGLRELSVCGWIRTPSARLGTLLSYTTEDNASELVVRGADVPGPGSVRLVIGDPASRDLPAGPLLDDHWHHMCLIWASQQGRYRFYVDRRLVATGSRFREGYAIPPGGSLGLGREPDGVGGPSEAFVGSLAGFSLWDRALAPGEVSNVAMGQGVPPRPILTPADALTLSGSVWRVNCTCLDHCP
ncbi:pentraxin-4 [Tachyglossus aculeatus]|uniref:pentraxin-4 n=1 Tax=Tachyglossus aculeatus TaxID=9261 RepID=UPI0018F4DE2D|nr:pentraxin-4 [Tachyglossus aculeatus]